MVSYSSDKTKYFVRSLELTERPVAVDQTAYYWRHDGVLHAVERRTGNLLWHFRMVEPPVGDR